MTPWTHVFVPRPDEMAVLDRAWEQAKQGNPSMVVLLAETGWGKTRLIQEWYEKVVSDSGSRYWPERIADDTAERRWSVTPDFRDHLGAVNEPMGFLYLGMRAQVPHPGMRASPFPSYPQLSDQLKRHLLPFWAAKRSRSMDEALLQETRDELLGVLGDTLQEAATIFPPLWAIPILIKLKNVRNLVSKLKEHREAREEGQRDLQQSHSQAHEVKAVKEIRETMDALLSILKKEDDLEPLPILIVFDDAQFCDPETAQLIESLLAEASRKSLPLLVVCTHWKGVWQEDSHEVVLGPGRSERIAHIPLAYPDIPADQGAIVAIKVHQIKMDEPINLAGVIVTAQPRMPREDVEFILNQAQGHPLYVSQLLLLLAARPGIALTAEGGLSENGRRLIERFSNYTDIALARFEALPERMRDILGFGSLAGHRFLHRIVSSLAKDSTFGPCYDDVSAELTEAGHQAITRSLSYEASEFDQVTFYRIARAHIGDLADEQQLNLVLRRTLEAIVQTIDIDSLEKYERMDLLSLCHRQLLQTVDEEQTLWPKLTFQYAQALSAMGLLKQSLLALLKLVEHTPEAGWKESTLTLGQVCQAARWLVLHGGKTENLAAEKIARLHLDKQLKVSPERATLLTTLADSLQNQGKLAEQAYSLYAQSSEMFREICRLSESADSLHNLAISLERLGDFELRTYCRVNVALDCYNEYLLLTRLVVDKFGETSQALIGISGALERLGDLAQLYGGDIKSAREYFEECHAILSKHIIKFGESPEVLEAVSVVLIKLGDLDSHVIQDQNCALSKYKESLNIRRRSIAIFGETPVRMRNLAVSLERLGDIVFWGQVDRHGACTF